MVNVPRRSLLTLGASGLALSACAPGSNSKGSSAAKPSGAVTTDAAALGKVTLTVWDQEVRGGQEKQMSTLIKEFEKAFPNISVKRVSRSFDDLTKTLRLAMTGDDAPDVVQANNTRSQMGQFVKAKQIVSLDRYAKTYGWAQRYPKAIRAVASYSPDATTFGSGQLFGMPQVGEVVGIYYNPKKLKAIDIAPPASWADLESALAKAKAEGEVPIAFGNLEKWPAAHLFGVLQGRYNSADAIRTLGYGQPGGDWGAQPNVQAATTFKQWADKNYFSKGFNGLGYDAAWQAFSKGTGVFLIAGTWLQADLAKAMGSSVRFALPPQAEQSGGPLAPGGTGLPFAITSKAEKADAAAAFINFITSPRAMEVLAKTGNLPVVGDTGRQELAGLVQTASGIVGKDVFTAFGTISRGNGLLPYLDWATPTMGDTLGAALQGLLAGKSTPSATVAAIGQDYDDFTKA